jgi:UDP-N-acetylglucosamine transferase subunit ALG13
VITRDEERAALGAEVSFPRVLVVVGSDHHPFDRLMRWVALWLDDHPEQRDFFFVQSGTSPIRPRCATRQLLAPGELAEKLKVADMVVCHGGPGSVLDCWNNGILPVAVPRLRRFGEVVDDHQLDFCRQLDDEGRVVMAQSYDDLCILFEKAIADRAHFKCEVTGGDVAGAVSRFAELVEALVDRRSRLAARRHALVNSLFGRPNIYQRSQRQHESSQIHQKSRCPNRGARGDRHGVVQKRGQ